MIQFQIVERPGTNLYKGLIEAMRSGELRTFLVKKRGRQVQHKNESYHGWLKWSHADGVINCEVLSPRKPGTEWRLFSAFLGRLADRYPDQILSINVQFPQAYSRPTPPGKRRRRRAVRRR
jgi:hypothetical protein